MCFKKRTLQEITEQWEKEKPILKKKAQIRAEKNLIYNKHSKFTLTKRLIIFIILNCTLVELFTGYLMYEQLQLSALTGLALDMTPQVALISAIVTEAFSFCIYCYKSLKENSKNGIVYDTAMLDKEIEKIKLEHNSTGAKG